jgi:hypothetical protein
VVGGHMANFVEFPTRTSSIGLQVGGLRSNPWPSVAGIRLRERYLTVAFSPWRVTTVALPASQPSQRSTPQ